MNTETYVIDRSWAAAYSVRPNGNGNGNAQPRLFGQAAPALVGTASTTHAVAGVAMKTAADRPPRGAPC